MSGSDALPKGSAPLRLADGAGGLVLSVEPYGGDGLRLTVPERDVALSAETVGHLSDYLASGGPPRLISVGGIERRYKVHPRTLYNWRKRHDFPAPLKVYGGSQELIWDAAEVGAWVREHRPRRGPKSAPKS